MKIFKIKISRKKLWNIAPRLLNNNLEELYHPEIDVFDAA